MKKRVLLPLLFLPLIAALIIFFVNQEPVPQNNFVVGIVNPNPGSKGLQETFINDLQKYALQEKWQLTFFKCENKKILDDDLKNLVSQNPDLIFTVTTPGTTKTLKALSGKDIPVVSILFDPVRSGIIKSIPQPGGNITGIQLRGSVPKALEWLLTISPETKNIFVPIKFDTKSAKMSLGDLKKAANSLGVLLNVAEVNTKKELITALDLIPEETDAIFLLNSIFVSTHAKTIAEAAIQKKLPTAASIGKDKEGILLTYSTQHELSGKQASRLGYQLLKGQNPAEIPAELADFILVVNLKTADKMGFTISDNILAQADKVIR